MSRSYRKPFAYMGGSDPKDKLAANRSFRRMINYSLKMCQDFEEYLPPHRYEASHNDVWGWNRDGNARYQDLGTRCFTELGLGDSSHLVYMLQWIEQCQRK